jgi:hypothetical protein
VLLLRYYKEKLDYAFGVKLTVAGSIYAASELPTSDLRVHATLVFNTFCYFCLQGGNLPDLPIPYHKDIDYADCDESHAILLQALRDFEFIYVEERESDRDSHSINAIDLSVFHRLLGIMGGQGRFYTWAQLNFPELNLTQTTRLYYIKVPTVDYKFSRMLSFRNFLFDSLPIIGMIDGIHEYTSWPLFACKGLMLTIRSFYKSFQCPSSSKAQTCVFKKNDRTPHSANSAITRVDDIVRTLSQDLTRRRTHCLKFLPMGPVLNSSVAT